MPSRQDQLHAAQFTVRRLATALVLRETEPVPSPFAGSAGAGLAGVLVAALVVAAFAGYGLVTGRSGARWRDTAVVIVEKETGARYVYRGDRLHPVLNYASAVLLAGGPRTVMARRAALAAVPRGEPLGIPGAPDSLPSRGGLLGPGWSVCTRSAAGTRGVSAVITVGPGTTGGRPLSDDASLVAANGEVYLLWHGFRHRVREPDRVLAALGWSGQRPTPVATALLAALPAGMDLTRVPVPGRGRPSPAARGARVGQVFVVGTEAGGRQYLVAWVNGLAPITQVQADLLLGDPDVAAAVGRREPTRLTPGEYAVAPHSPDLVPAPEPGALPASTPHLAGGGGAICVAGTEGGAAAQVRIDVTVSGGGAAVPNGDATVTGPAGAAGARVDVVAVPPGRAALVESLPAPGTSAGPLFLVTDLGVRYPLSGPEVPAILGFAGAVPIRVPADVVWLLPSGPTLDPALAGRSR